MRYGQGLGTESVSLWLLSRQKTETENLLSLSINGCFKISISMSSHMVEPTAVSPGVLGHQCLETEPLEVGICLLATTTIKMRREIVRSQM